MIKESSDIVEVFCAIIKVVALVIFFDISFEFLLVKLLAVACDLVFGPPHHQIE